MRNVLALDLAKRSGWAVSQPGRSPLSGSFLLTADTVGATLGPLFLIMDRWLDDMIQVHKPDLVGFEAPLVVPDRSAVTQRLLFGLASTVELVCARRNVRCGEAAVNTIRKHVVGSGHAKKVDVQRYCMARGWAFDDDNAADALVMLAYMGGA